MPTTNNHLQELTNSLTKSEKRYIKLSMPKDSALTHLFDLLKTKCHISDKEIASKIRHGNQPGNLAVIKNRLYNYILHTLNNYHAEKSAFRQVKDKIQSIEILYGKGLYHQCSKIIDSAKKIASKNNLYPSYLELSKWEKKIIVQNNYHKTTTSEVKKIADRDMEIISKLQAYHTIWYVKSKILIRLYSKGKARSHADLEAFRNIINNLPKKSKLPFDLESEYLYNHTLSAYYFCILDAKKSYDVIKKNHHLVAQNKNYFKDKPNIILSILTNAIYLSKKNNRVEETDQYLSELESFYTQQLTGKDLEIRIFTDRSITKLATIAMNRNYQKGVELIPEVKAGLERYRDEINATKLAGIYYSLSIIRFGNGEYSNALKWINRILNEVKISEAEDQYCFAQILHLIIHLELSNDDYIAHALKSLKRYLTTRKRMDEFEKSFIDLITQIIKTQKNSERQTLFSDFAQQMKVLKTNPFTQSAFDYFDFENWALGKLNNDI